MAYSVIITDAAEADLRKLHQKRAKTGRR